MNKTILAAVVVVILIGGAIAYFSMSGKKMTSDMSENTQTSNSMDKKAMEDGVMVGGALMTPNKDIVDNAVNSKDHTTVVAAIKAADLVATLKGKGPFTVFAPTNEAFEKLPAGTVDTLLMPENKSKLAGILTYHVVSGAYRASDIKEGMMLTTVNGQTLTFTQKDGKWWINNSAMIEIADVISSNGVTHVIDSVLLPK